MLHKFFLFATVLAAITSVLAKRFDAPWDTFIVPDGSKKYNVNDEIKIEWIVPINSQPEPITILLVPGYSPEQKPSTSHYDYTFLCASGYPFLDGKFKWTTPPVFPIKYASYRFVMSHDNKPDTFAYSPPFVLWK